MASSNSRIVHVAGDLRMALLKSTIDSSLASIGQIVGPAAQADGRLRSIQRRTLCP